MTIRKIIIRPPGTGNYADELHPKTTATHVVSTDGNIQTDIDTLKSGKATTDHNHTLTSLSEKSYASLTDKPTLGTASAKDIGTTSGTIPTLDANGKLSTTMLPALAITDTFVVATQAAMLALDVQVGDVAVRTDLKKTFILKTSPATAVANWQEMLTPTDLVQSVNGQTGTVTLTIPTNTNQLTKSDVYTKTEVDSKLSTAGYGDMLKATYDTVGNGTVNKARLADAVPWAGVSSKPSTFAPSAHTHTVAQITDFPVFVTIGGAKPTDSSLWFEEI